MRGDHQRRPASEESSVQRGLRVQEVQASEPLPEPGEDHLALDPRHGCSQAVMDARSEAQVVVVRTTDVEAVLYEHPDVLEAAVVGIPHDVLGEDIAAFVVAKKGTAPTADDIEAFCRDRLADYKCPKKIYLVKSIPTTATGKIRRRAVASALLDDRL